MKPLLIHIIGHNGSGKSTVAKKLSKDLGLSWVNGDKFRIFAAENISFFDGLTLTIPDKRHSLLNPLVLKYRTDMTRTLLRAKQSVIFDGSGIQKTYRTKLYNSLIGVPHTLVIIYCDIDEKTLLNRLRLRDTSSDDNGWVHMYKSDKAKRFEPPKKNECDVFLTYTQDNYPFVRESIKNLL